MTEFAELIEARDAAVADDDDAQKALDAAAQTLEGCQEHQAETAAAKEAAHKAIHDTLAEFGEYYLQDPDDGTVVVYKVSDEPPGYVQVHPIPGKTKPAKAKAAK